jgi:hypothetical protein
VAAQLVASRVVLGSTGLVNYVLTHSSFIYLLLLVLSVVLRYLDFMLPVSDQRVGLQVPVGLRIFTSSNDPNRLWDLPSLVSIEYRDCFPLGKVAGT